MKGTFLKFNKMMLYLPLFGMMLFVVLYILAATQYPGGSWQNPQAEGFSAIDNYLCDLLDYYAINGELNRGRHLSRWALGILCLSIFQIWMLLPRIFPGRDLNRTIMQISGMAALIALCFLSSESHDFVIYLAGILGSIAFIFCFKELKRHGYKTLFYLGLFCFLLFIVNYYMYESRHFVGSLPIVQKITMMAMLCWFSMLNLSIVRAFKTE